MIKYSLETILNIEEDKFSYMFTDHKDEVGICKDFDLDPDFDLFYELEQNEMFFLFVARDTEKDDEPVGYVYYTVANLPHYKDILSATMGAIFVEKESRTTGVGAQLITVAEEYLKEEYGIEFIDIRMKCYAPFEKLAESLGYEKKEYLYTKRV